jgi:hypothetical protein
MDLENVVIANSRRPKSKNMAALGLILALMFVAFAATMTDNLPLLLANVGLVVLCLFFAIQNILWSLDSSPQLVIDERGVFIKQLKIGIIAWQSIDGAYLAVSYGAPHVCFMLNDQNKYLNKLWPIHKLLLLTNKVFGFQPISASMNGIAIDPAQVCNLINEKVGESKSR